MRVQAPRGNYTMELAEFVQQCVLNPSYSDSEGSLERLERKVENMAKYFGELIELLVDGEVLTKVQISNMLDENIIESPPK